MIVATKPKCTDLSEAGSQLICIFLYSSTFFEDPDLLVFSLELDENFVFLPPINFVQLCDGTINCHKYGTASHFPHRNKKRSSIMYKLDEKDRSKNDGNSNRRKLKKKVVFADDIGLSLVSLKCFSKEHSSTTSFEEPQEIMKPTPEPIIRKQFSMVLCFQHPKKDMKLMKIKFEKNYVTLNDISFINSEVLGSVLVKNISYEKRVFLRCTCDVWKTFNDVVCRFKTATSPSTDLFNFHFNVPFDFDPGRKIEFAICYEVFGQQYWDNNFNANYKIMSVEVPQPIHATTYLKSLTSSDTYY